MDISFLLYHRNPFEFCRHCACDKEIDALKMKSTINYAADEKVHCLNFRLLDCIARNLLFLL